MFRDSLVMESNLCYRSWWWVGSAVLRVNMISGMARQDLNKTYSFIMESFFCYFLHLINPLINSFLLETSSANWGSYRAPFYAEGWEKYQHSNDSLAAAAPVLGGETSGWVENNALSLMRHNSLYPVQLWLSLIPTLPSNTTITP